MVNVRPPIPPVEETTRSPGRFNVLLAQERTQSQQPWAQQLGQLLEPQGVRAYVAYTGREALATVDQVVFHAAVVDLATPRDAADRAGEPEPGGLWLLELMHRRQFRTPVVVVDSRPVAGRDLERALNRALKLGAFTVVSRPRTAESVLAAVQRIIERRYRGRWPSPEPPPSHEP